MADRDLPPGPDAGDPDGSPNSHAPARRILTDISARSWEHPADRAALEALRRIPVFDEVLRKLFGLFGEKPIRLAFQANAVRVTERQFPEVHRIYREVCEVMDPDDDYELLVSQTPIVNAGAYGMKHPFIILNSGTVRLLEEDELAFILGHELGHVMSDHVLYRTMTMLLLRLAEMGFPIVGLAARAVLVALLEWSRKAELSSDRAGLLAIQDPEIAMRTMLKMAGGGLEGEIDLGTFIEQAEEYREEGDLADQVFKILNLIGTTHPFWVLRLAELRGWIEAGDYDRILRGEYTRRGEPDAAYQEDLRAASQSYAETAKGVLDQFAAAARRTGDAIRESFRR